MHTMVFVTHGLPHLSHEQFVRQDQKVHAPLAGKVPGLFELHEDTVRFVDWDSIFAIPEIDNRVVLLAG